MDILALLTNEFHLKQEQVDQTVKLIDEGNTIPFIARYRKEVTGSLDDQVLRELFDRLNYLRSLEKRKEEIMGTIEEQGKLTPDLQALISKSVTLAELEDLYRPYKPKRKTRASVAMEKGLAPLAQVIMEQDATIDPLVLAAGYINKEKGVESAEQALDGAQDILAESISDSADIRKNLRTFLMATGKLVTKAVHPEAETVYTMYYDYSEDVKKIVGHRVQAIDRAERENVIKVSLVASDEAAIRMITNAQVKGHNACSLIVEAACTDGYARLLFPSLERELRSVLTDRASQQAIKVFALNVKQLLMQPPVKGSVTLGYDPGFRTGCKIAVVDDKGKVLDTAVIYPTLPRQDIAGSEKTIERLIRTYGVTTIAIGNGTASRESEAFIVNLLKKMGGDSHAAYMMVSEAGASVYSASKLAAEEFPEYDVTLRSAVSIARRLQDPLAELVKIDPKSIGVGQYQHDLPKKELDEALGGVVEACVNSVGVDLNTASQSLLTYVAGVSNAVAKNIVAYREENNGFQNRKQLLKVAKLGPKAFEQCAGFLRVSGSDNVLDNTAVHPESYPAAEKLMKLCGFTMQEVAAGNIAELPARVEECGLSKLSQSIGVGEPTIKDMIRELLKPGRDPRDELPKPLLRSDVLEITDLKKGMELKGTIRNVIDFGAFVDIGVHEDGLVHISQICNRYIKHPLEAVNVGDVVTVWVLDVDVARKRIALTMKQPK